MPKFCVGVLCFPVQVTEARYGEYLLRPTHRSIQAAAYSLLPDELKAHLHEALTTSELC